jgi:hypothetical protein
VDDFTFVDAQQPPSLVSAGGGGFIGLPLLYPVLAGRDPLRGLLRRRPPRGMSMIHLTSCWYSSACTACHCLAHSASTRVLSAKATARHILQAHACHYLLQDLYFVEERFWAPGGKQLPWLATCFLLCWSGYLLFGLKLIHLVLLAFCSVG